MSRIRSGRLSLLTILIVLVVACGARSRDLVVRVTEKDGAVIPEASVMLVGPQEVQVTDEAGEVTWSDIEEEFAILYVVADGYTMYAGKWNLERGLNEAIIALEREPIDPDLKSP
jgi:hypothetical protein